MQLIQFSPFYLGNAGEILPIIEEKQLWRACLPNIVAQPATTECQSRIRRLFWWANENFKQCSTIINREDTFLSDYLRLVLSLFSLFSFLAIKQVAQSEMKVCTQPLLKNSPSIRWQQAAASRSRATVRRFMEVTNWKAVYVAMEWRIFHVVLMLLPIIHFRNHATVKLFSRSIHRHKQAI